MLLVEWSTLPNVEIRANPEDQNLPLFVYGTLLFGEVLDLVLGRRPAIVRRAAAPSWSARILPGEVYPGLVPDSLSAAGGLLLDDLTDEELEVLDRYEGEPYWREAIDVVDDRGSIVRAWSYLLDPSCVSEEVWTSRWFADNELAAFLSLLGGESA